MIPYLLAFSLPVLLYPLRGRYRTAYVMLVSGTWALFAGLRLGIGGNDYFAYQAFYESISGFTVAIGGRYEPLFRLFAIGCRSLGFTYNGFLLIVALIGTLPAVYVIDKRLEESALGLFIYAIDCFLYASFVILRQSIAMGLAFLAIDYLLDRKRIGFAVTALLAAGFHYAALIILPLYLMARPLKAWMRNALLAASAVVFGVLAFWSWRVPTLGNWDSFFFRLLNYISADPNSHLNILNFIEIAAVWIVVERYADDSAPLLKNSYLLYTCCALAATQHAILIRFGFFLELPMAILLGAAATSRKAPSRERIVLVAGLLAYFLAKTCRWLLLNAGGEGGFLPYRWIL